MSAFVVSKAHIDALIGVAVFGPKHVISPGMAWYGIHDPDTGERLTNDDADRIGTELWSENVRSVAYRYPDDESGGRPGPNDFTDEQAFGYAFPVMTPRISAVAALKAISSLEYQSCEHPEWEASWSARLLAALGRSLWAYLPGYNEAEWEIREGARP